MGINKLCAVQGAGPFLFWGPERGYNRGKFGCLKNSPFTNQWPKSIDIWYEALPWDKEFQVCANKVPEVINGPTPRGHFCINKHVYQVSDLRSLGPLVYNYMGHGSSLVFIINKQCI